MEITQVYCYNSELTCCVSQSAILITKKGVVKVYPDVIDCLFMLKVGCHKIKV